MRAVARAGRSGLLLALLLVLLGVRAPATLGTGDGHEPRASGIESVSTAPTVHDGVRDRVRLFAVARAAQTTPVPDTSWAMRPRAIGACAPTGRLPIGDVGCTGTPSAISTQQSSRAPPLSRSV